MAGAVEARAALEARLGALCDEARFDEAITTLLQGYGDEVAGFLAVHVGDADLAAEAFAVGAEDLWRGLPGFRREASFRTWTYAVFRHAAARVARDPHRRAARQVPLSQAGIVEGLQHALRQATATWKKTTARDAVAALRASLSAEEQALLTLRIDRRLDWLDIARILAVGDDDASAGADAGRVDDDPADLKKRAATLRKRFERLKLRLRAEATAAGLGGS